jgi:type IV pilus assembly protein PilA
MKTAHKKIKNNVGFTLMELMIVIAIIGIMASIAYPIFNKYQSRAHNTAALSDVITVKIEAGAYCAEWDHFPY